jgi:hypothetical protein
LPLTLAGSLALTWSTPWRAWAGRRGRAHAGRGRAERVVTWPRTRTRTAGTRAAAGTGGSGTRRTGARRTRPRSGLSGCLAGLAAAGLTWLALLSLSLLPLSLSLALLALALALLALSLALLTLLVGAAALAARRA